MHVYGLSLSHTNAMSRPLQADAPSLGKLIYEAGLALAKACEPFIASTSKSSSSSSAAVRTVEDLISHSQANKARLLHYYPLPEDEAAAVNGEGNGQDGDQLDSFCGTHIDHSLLTGLCESLFSPFETCVAWHCSW